MKTKHIVHTFIFNNRSELLILKRTENQDVYPGWWDIPGGSLNAGEDPAEGARRETAEETGIVSDEPLYLFGYTSNVDETKNMQFIRLIYISEITGNPKITPDIAEHTDFAWVKIKKISNYKMVEYVPDLLKGIEGYKELLNKI